MKLPHSRPAEPRGIIRRLAIVTARGGRAVVEHEIGICEIESGAPQVEPFGFIPFRHSYLGVLRTLDSSRLPRDRGERLRILCRKLTLSGGTGMAVLAQVGV